MAEKPTAEKKPRGRPRTKTIGSVSIREYKRPPTISLDKVMYAAAEVCNYHPSAVDLAVRTFFDMVRAKLDAGYTVTIPGHLTITRKMLPEVRYKNPKTGLIMTRPPRVGYKAKILYLPTESTGLTKFEESK